MQKKQIFIISFIIILSGINSVYGQTDLDRMIHDYIYFEFREPILEISGDSFNPETNEINFKIIYEDRRVKLDTGGASWKGLVMFKESILEKDLQKIEIDGKTITVKLSDNNKNILNDVSYKLISTGENKFETDGKLKQKVYQKWYENEGTWNIFSEFDQERLTTKSSNDHYEIIVTGEWDMNKYYHKFTNSKYFDPIHFIIEGKIQSDLFKDGEKFTFLVMSPGGSYNEELTFRISEQKKIILEKPEEKILTDEEMEQRAEQFAKNLEEQQRLQQERAQKEYEERKRLQELDKQKEESTPEPIIIPPIIIPPIIIPPVITEYIPEPIADVTVDPEPTKPTSIHCNNGMIIIDKKCMLPEPKPNLFAEFINQIMIFFSFSK